MCETDPPRRRQRKLITQIHVLGQGDVGKRMLMLGSKTNQALGPRYLFGKKNWLTVKVYFLGLLDTCSESMSAFPYYKSRGALIYDAQCCNFMDNSNQTHRQKRAECRWNVFANRASPGKSRIVWNNTAIFILKTSCSVSTWRISGSSCSFFVFCYLKVSMSTLSKIIIKIIKLDQISFFPVKTCTGLSETTGPLGQSTTSKGQFFIFSVLIFQDIWDMTSTNGCPFFFRANS